jgi:cytochrome oxidase Cu insertion factor (SCO1/SenC/PrrC family)
VTVDPNTDIPPRLKEYAAKFEARPGWTFLTGEKQNVTQVLKGLGGYTADLTKHPAMILVGDGGKDRWTRFYGFPSPERILEKVNELAAARRTEKGNAEGHHGHGAGTNPGKSSGAASRPAMGIPADDAGRRAYFTDLPLITQDNRQVKFYTDVLKDKVVLVSFIFTSCDEACPLLMQSFHEVQRLLGDRAGKEVFLVSISLDPETDTPEALKAYGERYRAGPGWTFLTGGKKNLDWVVYKLGQYRADIENHSTLFLLGDVKNGRWRKIPGSTPPEAIVMDIDTLFLKR